ncbi:MAG: trypsin-like peptidase domain-containing protein [Patescibacteria group bacterium]|nr:trypsin-like peptidase domain-containing protein [Patescibacteria group bacterium]
MRCTKYRYCVLTAFHVVNDTSTVFLARTENESKEQELELINGSTTYDWAVLKFRNPRYHPRNTARIGRSSWMMRGSMVYTMGSCVYGNYWMNGPQVLHTDVKKPEGLLAGAMASINEFHPKVLLPATPIYGGYSGGPMLNERGEIVGINIAFSKIPERPEVAFVGSPIDDIIKAAKIIKR